VRFGREGSQTMHNCAFCKNPIRPLAEWKGNENIELVCAPKLLKMGSNETKMGSNETISFDSSPDGGNSPL
jgi:hypothetical protein